jgi:hypothetical protein
MGASEVNDLFLEIRKDPDGHVYARRKDGKPLTPEDRQTACCLADAMPGITAADVLRVFPGARVVTEQEAAALMAVNGVPQ